jgi:hypothetical protein
MEGRIDGLFYQITIHKNSPILSVDEVVDHELQGNLPNITNKWETD